MIHECPQYLLDIKFITIILGMLSEIIESMKFTAVVFNSRCLRMYYKSSESKHEMALSTHPVEYT